MAALGVDETASIRVTVDPGPAGIEAGAREARYAALAQLAAALRRPGRAAGAHPRRPGRDGAARPGPRVRWPLAAGDAARRSATGAVVFARPLLELTRAQTEAACRADGHRVVVRPAQRRPALPALPRPARRAAGARARAGPGRRRGAGPHRPSSCATTWTSSTRSPTRRTPGPGARTASTWRAGRRSGRRCADALRPPRRARRRRHPLRAHPRPRPRRPRPRSAPTARSRSSSPATSRRTPTATCCGSGPRPDSPSQMYGVTAR